MDDENLRTVGRMPGFVAEKVQLARSFDVGADGREVADPYYGTEAEFEAITDQLEAACLGILYFVSRES